MALRPDQLRKLALRAVLGGLNNLFLFQSVLLVDVHVVVILKNTTPMYVLLIGYFFMQEVVTWKMAASFVLCLVGVVLLFDPSVLFSSLFQTGAMSERNFNHFLGTTIMVFWSINYAIVQIIIKKSDLISRHSGPKS